MMINVEFKKMSQKIGSNFDWVQGAGGNTSIKENGSMWIKASGKWLAHTNKENIFVLVDHERICKNINDNKYELSEDVVLEKNTLRPSIETTLHALMPHKVVLHTHPVELLHWLIRENAREQLDLLLKNINWEWIPYVRPGVDLTRKIQQTVRNQDIDVLILGNHGLIVGADDCLTALSLMEKILNYCKIKPRNSNLCDIQDADLVGLSNKFNMRLPKYLDVHSLALDATAFDYCNKEGGILYPDQAVFLGSRMFCFKRKKDKDIAAELLKGEELPLFIILEGKGVLISDNAESIVDEMLYCHTKILMRIAKNISLKYLTTLEVSQLLDWEPEKYRQALKK